MGSDGIPSHSCAIGLDLQVRSIGREEVVFHEVGTRMDVARYLTKRSKVTDAGSDALQRIW